MRYVLKCRVCGSTWSVRGSYDPSVNALELNDDDNGWLDACEHNGEYDIIDEELIDDDF
jgi:hypothetical protein